MRARLTGTHAPIDFRPYVERATCSRAAALLTHILCRVCSANDAGVSAFKDGRFGEAFNGYTEAIRLCPERAVYHANRCATHGRCFSIWFV